MKVKKPLKIIIFHPQGNANVRSSAIAFVNAQLLSRYVTSIACFPQTFLYKLTNYGPFKELRKRSLDIVLKPFTKTHAFRELGRIIATKANLKKLIKQETGFFSVQEITRNIDRKVAAEIENANDQILNAVYAFEDGAYYSFLASKKRKFINFYDLPTGYWRAKLRILEAEKKKFPQWESTITGLFDSVEKLRRKDEEIKMADMIFVASQFTASTLNDFQGQLPPIKVMPYGFPEVSEPRNYREININTPIKLLFVGNLSQQKGIAYLFEAIQPLGNKVTLTLVGRKADENNEVLNSELNKHTWIPSLHHSDILLTMREHDVLVFPTLFDGFGLVITEAMSQGTPVIATYNCAGPDLIENGKNGWLVETGSVSALQNVIESLIQNPNSIAVAGKAARETAKHRPWNVFQNELATAINSFNLHG
ncbi:MAG: glycosyltransferase family 4 protein [bacterium]|nr:glycosyltransferase family 4 protein [bacterium]